jgi:hypothetical protein
MQMQNKVSLLIIALMGIFFTEQINAQASLFNNLCAACTGNGYSYCPTTGVCFEDQGLAVHAN